LKKSYKIQVVSFLFALLWVVMSSPIVLACDAHQPIPIKLQRIISSDPGATEIITALGKAEQIVGIDSTSSQPNPDRPLPVVGYQRQLPAEGLLSLKPDIVIGGQHMGPEETLSLLRKASVEVLAIDSAIDATTLQAKVTAIASSLNSEALAEKINQSIKEKVGQIKDYKTLDGKRMVFLLQTSQSQKVLRVGGKGSVGDTLINLFDAENSVSFNNYQTLSEESLLALKPEIIILGTPKPHNVQTIETFLDQFPLLKALSNKQIILPFDTASLVAGLSLSSLDEARSFAAALSNQTVAKE